QFFRDHHLTPIRGVSAPQHSTPYPLNLTKSPEPDELEKDFNGLKQWQTEFKDRPIAPVPQEA
ncbi:hypothetical protein, partial [Acidithiobacillus ferriphilus]